MRRLLCREGEFRGPERDTLGAGEADVVHVHDVDRAPPRRTGPKHSKEILALHKRSLESVSEPIPGDDEVKVSNADTIGTALTLVVACQDLALFRFCILSHL